MKEINRYFIIMILMLNLFSCTQIQPLSDDKKKEYIESILTLEKEIKYRIKNKDIDYINTLFLPSIKNNYVKKMFNELKEYNVNVVFSDIHSFKGDDKVVSIVAITIETETIYFEITFKKIDDAFKIYDFDEI